MRPTVRLGKLQPMDDVALFTWPTTRSCCAKDWSTSSWRPGSTSSARPAPPNELMLKVRSYNPDIAIVDIRMPPTHTDEGLQAAKKIREQHPDVAVLVLSQYVELG